MRPSQIEKILTGAIKAGDDHLVDLCVVAQASDCASVSSPPIPGDRQLLALVLESRLAIAYARRHPGNHVRLRKYAQRTGSADWLSPDYAERVLESEPGSVYAEIGVTWTERKNARAALLANQHAA